MIEKEKIFKIYIYKYILSLQDILFSTIFALKVIFIAINRENEINLLYIFKKKRIYILRVSIFFFNFREFFADNMSFKKIN